MADGAMLVDDAARTYGTEGIVCQRASYREFSLLVLVLEGDFHPKKRGDLVACDEQQLADKVGDRGLERQRVHIRV